MLVLACIVPAFVFLGGVVSTQGAEQIVLAGVVLACVLLGVRIVRLGIYAGPDQLVVRDYFRTYRVDWTAIAGFEPPPPYGALRKAGLRIRLADGRLISATLYAPNGLDTGHRATLDVIGQLSRLLEQRTGLASGPAPDR